MVSGTEGIVPRPGPIASGELAASDARLTDWAPEWHAGVPPDGELGVSGPINWLYVYVLERAAQLERWHGETELAARAQRIAADLAVRLDDTLWGAGRGLLADDLGHSALLRAHPVPGAAQRPARQRRQTTGQERES